MKLKIIPLATLIGLFTALPVAAQNFTFRAEPYSGNVEFGINLDRRDYYRYHRSHWRYPYRRYYNRRHYNRRRFNRVYYNRRYRRNYVIYYNPRTGRYRRVYYRNYHPAPRYYRYYNFYR